VLEEERLAAINRKLDELRSSEAYKKSLFTQPAKWGTATGIAG
jgi:hypothetical protein